MQIRDQYVYANYVCMRTCSGMQTLKWSVVFAFVYWATVKIFVSKPFCEHFQLILFTVKLGVENYSIFTCRNGPPLSPSNGIRQVHFLVIGLFSGRCPLYDHCRFIFPLYVT